MPPCPLTPSFPLSWIPVEPVDPERPDDLGKDWIKQLFFQKKLLLE
jgi:hypothetical protein